MDSVLMSGLTGNVFQADIVITSHACIVSVVSFLREGEEHTWFKSSYLSGLVDVLAGLT